MENRLGCGDAGFAPCVETRLQNRLSWWNFPEDYHAWILDVKARIRSTQHRAVVAVNVEQTLLYWSIGKDILVKQSTQGWGSKVIERLASDLKHEFPEMTGLSARNLKYMRSFAEAWPDFEIVQRFVAQLPWGHNCTLLDKLDDQAAREWYVRAYTSYGWTRPLLVHQIESRLHERQGAALTNFERTLPAHQHAIACELVKHGALITSPLKFIALYRHTFIVLFRSIPIESYAEPYRLYAF